MAPTDKPETPKDTRIVDPQGKPAQDGIIQVRLSDLEAMFSRLLSQKGGAPSDEVRMAVQALGDLKDQVARTTVRSNSIEDYHGVSEFAPKGKAEKRKMKFRFRQVHYLGAQIKEEECTPIEINLINAFTEDKEARNGAWKAIVSRDGGKPTLTIDAPHGTMDNRQNLPSMQLLLTELLEGKDSANPDSMLSRIAELESKIRELTKNKVA